MASVTKTPDAFSTYWNKMQEAYDHSIATLEKLRMTKSALAASSAANFAPHVGKRE